MVSDFENVWLSTGIITLPSHHPWSPSAQMLANAVMTKPSLRKQASLASCPLQSQVPSRQWYFPEYEATSPFLRIIFKSLQLSGAAVLPFVQLRSSSASDRWPAIGRKQSHGPRKKDDNLPNKPAMQLFHHNSKTTNASPMS